jgi:S-adenosylmethionine synthetase
MYVDRKSTTALFIVMSPYHPLGQTKYDGEKEIKKFNPAAIILRVPILYGITEYNGESAVNSLIDSVKDVSS